MKKNQYCLFLLDFSQQPGYFNELNVHHNFNHSTTVTGMLFNYIMIPGKPLRTDMLRNIDSRLDIKVAFIQDFLSCNKRYLKPQVVLHKKPDKQPA